MAHAFVRSGAAPGNGVALPPGSERFVSIGSAIDLAEEARPAAEDE